MILKSMSVIVALRKESVDRNKAAFALADSGYWSLSARRAWIEIVKSLPRCSASCVALRKESVDRNIKSSVK